MWNCMNAVQLCGKVESFLLSSELKKRVGQLMGNKGDDEVQALSGPPVVTCSLIPHDSKPMIFSTVRFSLANLYLPSIRSKV